MSQYKRRPARPIAGLTDSDLSRFWSRVVLPDEKGCMLWLAGQNEHGYGIFKIAGFDHRSSRVSLWIAEGPPPSEHHQAAHSCRNRHCVAPAHLRWATPAENQADRHVDGTKSVAERNGKARLTWGTVYEIREKSARGARQRHLAAEYSISQSQVGRIVRGEHWTEGAGS